MLLLENRKLFKRLDLHRPPGNDWDDDDEDDIDWEDDEEYDDDD